MDVRAVALIAAAHPRCGSHVACAVPGVVTGQGEAQERLAQLRVAMPARSTNCPSPHVVIGMDPHTRSAAIEAMTRDETVLGTGRFGADQAGYTAMVAYAKQWPDRVRTARAVTHR
ncbi:hypothetical protein Apa02nite_096160 [Actinoplanes palleronii]|uniref:Transposase n=2 Tax=Actinoplanes palleronii TaxID=113570 RepID=A0ABQ4BS59_9ACTN|nr:hypothetical protein Apa02nite_096160 [Actinoplanes palleronii]